MKIRIDEETEIETSTQEDIDYVEANFREGDRLEHESLDGGRTLLSDFEDCWTVRCRGMVIGYCGVAIPVGATVFSPGRWHCYMSCANADRIKLAYVKKSRKVMHRIAAETPSYVTEFRSLPAVRYAGSVRWHERVLKMHRLSEVEYKGEKFVMFNLFRKELEV